MNRRTLLCQCIGAGAAATLAGCIAERPGAEDDASGAEPEEQPVATDGGTEPDGGDGGPDDATADGTFAPELTGVDVETHGSAEEAIDEAEIDFGDESVTVEGTITAPTPCYEAAVQDAEYSESDDELRVTMTTRKTEGDRICAQVVTGVEYALTVSFDGGTPIHVTVCHETADDETTTVAEDSCR